MCCIYVSNRPLSSGSHKSDKIREQISLFDFKALQFLPHGLHLSFKKHFQIFFGLGSLPYHRKEKSSMSELNSKL